MSDEKAERAERAAFEAFMNDTYGVIEHEEDGSGSVLWADGDPPDLALFRAGVAHGRKESESVLYLLHGMMRRQLDHEGLGPDYWGDDEHEAFRVLEGAVAAIRKAGEEK